jgi:hypothetical protein
MSMMLIHNIYKLLGGVINLKNIKLSLLIILFLVADYWIYILYAESTINLFLKAGIATIATMILVALCFGVYFKKIRNL